LQKHTQHCIIAGENNWGVKYQQLDNV